MVQCPDCESKDRITIAGKVFCANCGTPWTPSPETLSAEAAQKAATPASTSNAVAPSQVISPSTTTPAASELKPRSIKPATPASPLEVAKESQPSTAVSGSMIQVRSFDEKKAASAQIQQTDSISKFTPKPPTQTSPRDSKPAVLSTSPIQPTVLSDEVLQKEKAESSPATPLTPIAQDASVQSPPKTQIEPAIPSVGQTISPTAPSTQVDADVEIPDLHDHAQAVLTDKQFNDLADLTTNTPAPSSDDATLSPATVANVLRTPTLSTQVQSMSQAVSQVEPSNTAVPTPPVISPSPQPITQADVSTTTIPVAVTPKPVTPVSAAVTPPNPPVTRLQDMLAPTNPTPVPAVQPQSAPQPVAPSPSQPQPQPEVSHEKLVITPTIQPPTMRLPNGGIDGVSSMSRDQALKLALGDSAEADQANVGGSYKPLKVAIAVVVVLLIGGYIWQINYPNLAIKIASTRAGLSANAPHYLPSGWAIDRRIVSNQNKLEFTIKSPNGNQLKVTQLKTDWDSAALLESYVSSEANNIETVQAQGLTIYLYGDHQASWINHGNWFRLDGAGSGLSQEELIKIATSL